MPKNWCFQTVVLEKTSWVSLGQHGDMEIKPVNLKGNQPWIVTGRTDAKAEAPVFWSSDTNRQLIGKVPDPGEYQGQKEKRVSEYEMAWWHPWGNEHNLSQILGDGEGQGGLACCSPWCLKKLDKTGWMNSKWVGKYREKCNLFKYRMILFSQRQICISFGHYENEKQLIKNCV